jgi:hypothetical protein
MQDSPNTSATENNGEVPSRRGSRRDPFALCLPLSLTSIVLLYFALAAPQGWHDSLTSKSARLEGTSLVYTSMQENLAYKPLDWVVTDDESNQVLDWLSAEQPEAFNATVQQLQHDHLLQRLLTNATPEDREAYADIFTKVDAILEQNPEDDEAASALPMAPFDWMFGEVSQRNAAAELLLTGGYHGTFTSYTVFAIVIAAILLLASSLGYFRRVWSLWMIRSTILIGIAAALFYVFATWQVAGFLESVLHFGEAQTTVPRFFWWYDLTWPVALLVLFDVVLLVYSYSASVIHLYCGELVEEASGDVIFEDVRTGGRDPQYRRSWQSSALAHVFFLIILPWILSFYGCVEDYRVPKGSGNPVVALVRVVKPKKVEKKTYILNPHSAISFRVPTLEEDSEVEEQIKEMIEHAYEASNALAGKMGAGGGTTGGWPDGMEDHEVRFIRLSFSGPEWDDGMGVDDGRADMNFLDEFHRQTGFNIRSYSESHPIHYLGKYRKGYAPPFVYMTGNGSISVGSRDRRVLREYLEGGGMLFADCGYPSFHNSFVSFISKVFPGKRLRVIADDDPLFQMPYRFNNGPPALWHHGGHRCLGIKHKGRWCVFYHPGDINDAWKTGHNGVGSEAARAAYQVGINVIYYSFTNYLALTRKYRK